MDLYNLQDECNGYGFEVDSWACGVIMYTLLIGRPPFWHRKQMMLIRQIMRGEYTMTGPDWAEVTSETRDLVRFKFSRALSKWDDTSMITLEYRCLPVVGGGVFILRTLPNH